MKKISLLFLAVIYIYSLAFSQNTKLSFDHLSVENGLASNQVNCTLQDNKGFMWFGTSDGLCRYDGYEFKTYRYNQNDTNSINDSFVVDMTTDTAGYIYIVTGLGKLSVFNPINESFTTNNKVKALSVFINKKGEVWTSNHTGPVQYFRESNTIRQLDGYFKGSKRDSMWLCAMEQDTDTSLFVCSYMLGFSTYNLKTQIFTEISNPDPIVSQKTKRIKSSLFKTSRGLYTSTEGGIFQKYNPLSKKLHQINQVNTRTKSFANLTVTDLKEDAQGRLWLATDGEGLFISDTSQTVFNQYTYFSEDPNSISSNQLKHIYFDRTGIAWIATYNGGINKFDINKKKFKAYKAISNNPQSLANQSVLSLFEDKDKTIWIGTDGGGADRLDPKQEYPIFQHTQFSEKNINSISGNVVKTIFQDQYGCMWFGIYNGLFCKLDTDTKKITRFKKPEVQGLYSNSLWCIEQDLDSNIWFGFINDFNLWLLNPTTNKLNRASEKWPNTVTMGYISCLYSDSQNRLWVGSSGNPLQQISPDRGTVLKFEHNKNIKNSLSNNMVQAVFEDREQNIWIATADGLNRLKSDNTFEHYFETDGLASNNIYAIQQDNNGFLWLSTNNGISKFDPVTKKCWNFDKSDGLPGMVYNTSSALKAYDGKLYFGSTEGLCSFYPEEITINETPPEVVLTDFQIFNTSVQHNLNNPFLKESITNAKKITLTWRESVITFKYAALNYTGTHKNKFAYKLVGFDEDWVSIGSKREANYTNLNPGSYTFMVKASNNDNVWNSKATSITLIITPPFWKTTWFQLLVLVIIAIVIITLVHLRIKTVERQKIVLKRLVAERTAEVEEKNISLTKQNILVETQNKKLQDKTEEIIQQNEEITQQKEEIEATNNQLALKNKHITDSIYYAYRIQKAVLPDPDYLNENLPEHFVYFVPKDIVSGDFLWVRKINNFIVIATADCTGHGVPGAFMSMLGVSFLNEIANSIDYSSAAIILNLLREKVKSALKQQENKNTQKDGMDMAIYILDSKLNTIQFAGANNPLIIIRNKEIIQIKPDRQPIGIYVKEEEFTNHSIQVFPNDVLYTFSDGYVDQFGGGIMRKFMIKDFKKMLLEIHDKPMKEQKDILHQTLLNWRGSVEQIDDILVFGLRV